MEVLRQDEPPRRGSDAGKVLGLLRVDAPEGAQGKPCGASHIPKEHKCSKNAVALNKERLRKAALAGGLTITAALGLALIARGKVEATNTGAKTLTLPSRSFTSLPSRTTAPSEDELETLEAYIFSSRNLNRRLRSGKIDAGLVQDVNTIDSWMHNTKPKQDRYYRGIASEKTSEFFRNATVGQTYTDPAYGSFSRVFRIAQGFAEEHTAGDERVVVRTRAPFYPMPTDAIDNLNRKRGLFEDTSGGEEEVLAPRGASYRITRILRGVSSGGRLRKYTLVDLEYLGVDTSRSLPGS